MPARCRRCAASATATRSRARLADGTIDALCSDHTPVDDDGKQLPFAEAEPGATGLELLLPLDAEVGRGAQAAARRDARADHAPSRRGSSASTRAASRPARPPISPSSIRGAAFRVAPQTLKSQGKNTPFLGYELAGRVRYTLVAGNVVYEA